MKRFVFLAIALATSTLLADDEVWQTDFNKAVEVASKENKPILLFFTGDWCPPCKMMKRDVLSTKEFIDFAKANLILFKADMLPTGEAAVPELDKQNQYLTRKLGINGFPTFVLINSKGKPLGQFSGYRPGGPEGFIAWVSKSIK